MTQNQELKDMLLEATPFVRQAKSEELNYASMKKYLDDNIVQKTIQDDIEAIKNQQQYDGGFSYAIGSPSNLYITSSILLNIIALEDANVIDKSSFNEVKQKATDFIQMKVEETYNNLKSKNL
ncbi:MAG TPA: hypothetical protein PKD85_21775, partial [Saprospiraceae bacterium]|nr:hypothetical protein [Saprospiraceae bacterium]